MPRRCIKFSVVYLFLITIKILSETIILKTIKTVYLYKGENRFNNKTRFISIDHEAFSVILVNYAWLSLPSRNFSVMVKRQTANYCIIFCMLFTYPNHCFTKKRAYTGDWTKYLFSVTWNSVTIVCDLFNSTYLGIWCHFFQFISEEIRSL